MSLKLSLSETMERYRKQTAVMFPGGSWTYADLSAWIRHVRSGLLSAAVEPGTRIAVLMPAQPETIALFWAILSAGCTAVMVSTRYSDTQIRKALKTAACKHLVSRQPFVMDGISSIDSGRIFGGGESPSAKDAVLELPDDQPATVLFTSGSSDEPKAVLHAVAAHRYSAFGANENITVMPGDQWLLSLPLCHAAGIGILFRTMMAGGTVKLPDLRRSVPAEMLASRYLTHLSLVPAQLNDILKERGLMPDIHRGGLKAILLGGGHTSEKMLGQAVELGLPVHNSYGLTETASQVTATSSGDLPERIYSAGQVLKYRELKIGNHNEILVRGQTLCLGYVRGGECIPVTDPDGWFHTGDRGRIDNQGYLHVSGRLDEMFISGGENIYPEEIEKHLTEHSGIENAVVVGVPDEKFGKRPVAFIRGSWNPEDLKVFLAGRIEKFKIPDRFYPWPEDIDESKPSRQKLIDLAVRTRT